jgi:hypothetical protein
MKKSKESWPKGPGFLGLNKEETVGFQRIGFGHRQSLELASKR